MDKLLTFAFFVFCLHQVYGDVVSFASCTNHPNANCTISQVRINPCPEAEKGQACKIGRGKKAELEFDFTPSPNVDGLESKVYWATGTMDLPWIGMDTNGCGDHTQCPTQNHQQTYRYDLLIGKKFPARKYEIKWRLFKEEELECCFTTYIQLTK